MKSTYVYTPASKTFTACLIISLLILGPLAPLSLASPSSSSRAATTSTAAPTTPAAGPALAAPVTVAPAITATKTDSFPDPDGNGKAEPGNTITYDVNISNSG